MSHSLSFLYHRTKTSYIGNHGRFYNSLKLGLFIFIGTAEVKTRKKKKKNYLRDRDKYTLLFQQTKLYFGSGQPS